MSSAPSPSSDAQLLASYNVILGPEDDEDGEFGIDDADMSTSPLSLPSSMMESDDEGYAAAASEAQVGDAGWGRGTSRKSRTNRSGTSGGKTKKGLALSSSGGAAAGAGGVPGPALREKLIRLEQDLARVAHEKELLTSDLVRERRRYAEDMTGLRRRNREEFGQVRTKQAEIEAEIPVLRARLAQSKDALRNLEISAQLFAELDKLPESKLSVREFVLVQVHRMLSKEKDKAEVCRRESEQLRTELARVTADSERTAMSLRHRLSASEDREKLLTAELDRMDTARAELSRRLSEASESASELRSKGVGYDALQQRANALEREVESTKHRADLLQSSVDTLQSERDSATARTLELQQRCEILTVDKAYLAREGESAAARCTRLEETIEQLRDEKRDLINAKQQFHEELLQEKEKARVGYEDRLSSEIARLQQQSSTELARVRDANAQVHTQEVAALREQSATAREQASAATAELRELREAYDQLRINATRDRSELESQLAEMRSRVKIQTYEIGRTNLAIEEQRQALDEAKQSNIKHEQRFSVLREEFLKLEGSAARSKVEYESMLAAEREKVLGYEALEMELDQAVMIHAVGAHGEEDPSATGLLPVSFDPCDSICLS